MAAQNDDRGAKPYKTYKASSRPRRSQLDDELAGARPPRRRPADKDGAAGPTYPPRSDKAYQTYGPAPDSKAAKKRNKKAGAAPGRRRRFRWWHIPVAVFALLVIAGVVVTVLAWPGYQKFDRAVDKANKRVDKKTKAQLTPDDGWIWRKGTTRPPLRPRRGRAPGALGHRHAHALQPRRAHGQHALHPARHAGQHRRLRPAEAHPGDVVRRPLAGASRPSRSSPASPSTTSWWSASRASRGSSTASAASTCTSRRRSPPGRDPASRAPPSASSPSRRACTTSTARTRCCTCASARPTRRATSRAPRGSRRSSRRSRRSSCSPATSPSCRTSASTS